jgi:hypothetical protein
MILSIFHNPNDKSPLNTRHRAQTGTGNILLFLFCFLISACCFPRSAFAACASPAGNEADMIYNGTSHVMQYCNGAAWKAMGPVPGAGPSNSNTVFITSTTNNGNFGITEGIAIGAANNMCTARAQAAGLPGTYKAWIAASTGTDDPATTFTQSSVPYKEVDGTTIAANWAGLISGTLTNAITLDETGATRSPVAVWTNVATNGTAAISGSNTTNCSAWTNNAVLQHGDAGLTGSATSTWTINGTPTCSGAYSLYCFQQDGGLGCSNPVGNEGAMMYNGTSHVMQYCDGTNWHAMGPVPGAGPSNSNTVFVTSINTIGNSGSVAAANTTCQTLATAAGLAGTYKAWLAVTTGVDDPATTFTQSTIPYKEVGGTTIASNWAGLISGTLTNAITLDELGVPPVSPSTVWTNVATNGTAIFSGNSSTDNCNSWIGGGSGYVGTYTFTTSTWTSNGSTSTCNALGRSHLYCFQQDGGAGCSGPPGNEGDYMYNGTSHVYQYCDGAFWRQMQ